MLPINDNENYFCLIKITMREKYTVMPQPLRLITQSAFN